jgi:hypothetical protein
MSILHRRLVAPLLVFGVLSNVGCGNGSNALLINGAVGPSSVPSSPFVRNDVLPQPPGSFVSRGVTVQPALIQAQRVATPFCPLQPPFIAPFSVVFTGDGRSDLFLTSVQMQSVDLAEIRAGVTTLGRPELAVQFGSTTIPTFGTRAFPFAFPFGCNGLTTGTLTVIVVVADSRGRETRTIRQLGIR